MSPGAPCGIASAVAHRDHRDVPFWIPLGVSTKTPSGPERGISCRIYFGFYQRHPMQISSRAPFEIQPHVHFEILPRVLPEFSLNIPRHIVSFLRSLQKLLLRFLQYVVVSTDCLEVLPGSIHKWRSILWIIFDIPLLPRSIIRDSPSPLKYYVINGRMDGP